MMAGARYDDPEQALQQVIAAIKKTGVFHTIAQGTPFKVTWTGAGCRCDLASGGTQRISGDRFRGLLAAMQDLEVLHLGHLITKGAERYAVAAMRRRMVVSFSPRRPRSAK
ncbi:MAG: hypothetical protein QOI63_753 [Thermoplasmata archaeon]|jgi:hypothetical protein|nr:hypothetical protein [Thermoplasmata archaeon]